MNSIDTFNTTLTSFASTYCYTTLTSFASTYCYDLPKHPYLPNKHPINVSTSVESTINQYIKQTKESFLNELDNLNQNSKDNLTNRECHILNKLQKRTDIVIKKSDEGGKIVVETTENYIKDGLKHLSDGEIYHRLDGDNQELHENINRYLKYVYERGLINSDMYEFLTLVK